MVKIMVFDTETTGLPPIFSPEFSYKEKKTISYELNSYDWNTAIGCWDNWIEKWPYITQLSYIIYDTETPKKTKFFNKYINLEKNVEISLKASELTHIYKSYDDAIKKGVNPKSNDIHILDKIATTSVSDIMSEFMTDFIECDHIVGHNVDFDKKMVLAELKRLSKYDDMKIILNSKKFFCTMMKSISVCHIIAISKNDKKYIKFPSLSEAYEIIVGNKIHTTDLHNALYDVVLCLQIFCKLNDPYNIEVYGKNNTLTKLINTLSPRRSARIHCK
jgi:DNA polymerase-3 subunit epsilon